MMTLANDIERLSRHLKRNPLDQETRLILADALEEDRHTAAAAIHRQMTKGIYFSLSRAAKDELHACEEGRHSDLSIDDSRDRRDIGMIERNDDDPFTADDGSRFFSTCQILDRTSRPRVVVLCEQDIEELLFAINTGTIDGADSRIRRSINALRRALEELKGALR